MIANIDENVARLEAFLRKTGLRDNTIFIFMTDNGGTAGVKVYNAGLRGHKTENYDGGHRVPCFVRWPAGKLRAAGDVETPAQIQDLLPTLIELCGLKKPAKASFDGASLAGLLKVKARPPPDRMLVVQYGQTPKKDDVCVIWNQWRLIKGQELYDIRADREQKHDLAAQHKDVVAKMRGHYEKWWSRIEPSLGDFVTISIGAQQADPVQLTSSDWQNLYIDNAGHIERAEGGARGGSWNVFVGREGDYEVSLRRWPSSLDLPLTGKADSKSKALPIAAARLMIADQDLTAKTEAQAKEAHFRLKLPRGKTQLHGWFQDVEGNDLCGSYYALVNRR